MGAERSKMRPIDADALMDNIKLDAKKAIEEDDKIGSFWLGYAAGLVIKEPTIQSEATDEQVLDYCKKRCLHIVTSDVFQSTHLTHKVSFGDKDHVWIDGKQYISLRRFQEAVKEAQPKEGHWIEGGIYRDVVECYCSECGQLMTTAATVRMNYCPRCGARMKEGESNG